jgi:prepilin-type N-terminal cleavage/methylation domain-containing protein
VDCLKEENGNSAVEKRNFTEISRSKNGGTRMKNYGGFSLLELMIVVAIILIIAVVAVPSLLRSQQTAQESKAVAQLRTINTAEVTYISSNQGSYGDTPSLIAQGLLDARFTGSISGYSFTLSASGNSYTAIAAAVSSNSGRFDFYTLPDYVIRYSTDPTRAPGGLNGQPVR